MNNVWIVMYNLFLTILMMRIDRLQCWSIRPITAIKSTNMKEKKTAFITTTTSKIIRQQQQETKRSCFSPLILFAVPRNDENAPPQRKKKKNKYAQFSKASSPSPSLSSSPQSKQEVEEQAQVQLDPFELMVLQSKIKTEAFEKKKRNEEEKKKSKRLGLPSKNEMKKLRKTKQQLSFDFPSNRSIDPYDPTTFGYIEIGVITGAHGVHGWCKIKSETDFPKERLFTPGVKHLKAPTKRAPRRIILLSGKPFKAHNDEYLVQLDGITDRNDAAQIRGHVLYVRKEEKKAPLKNKRRGRQRKQKSGDSSNKNEETEQTEIEHLKENELGEEALLPMQQQQVDKQEQINPEEQQQQEEKEFHISDLIGLPVYLAGNDDGGEIFTTTNNTDVDNLNKENLFVGYIRGVVIGDDLCAIPGLSHDMLEVTIPHNKNNRMNAKDNSNGNQSGATFSSKDKLVLIPFVPQIVPKVSIEDKVVYISPPKGLLDLTYRREEKVRIKGFLPAVSSFSGL